MGMFDYIEVKDSKILPWPEDWNTDVVLPRLFQTKDLVCGMELYEIDGEGQLIFIKEAREWREDKNDTLLGGYLETVSSERIFQSQFSDYICFYEFIRDYSLKEDAWIEYKALFQKGLLQAIEVQEFRLQDNSERKEGMERLSREFAGEKILREKSYYPLVKAGRWVRSKNRSFWYRIFIGMASFFQKIAWFVIRRF